MPQIIVSRLHKTYRIHERDPGVLGAQMLCGLGLQCLWIALLVTVGHAAMGRTMRRLDVQGG
ncbi:hypothetical protein [Cupriavidus basilensis]|uniref:hypothetical protein n=1 Tax=Cupriavidus basilensis TaxID=68895 RepID=UPI001D9622B7|nr:hypothetical protein [Cupriavidus basilensis]